MSSLADQIVSKLGIPSLPTLLAHYRTNTDPVSAVPFVSYSEAKDLLRRVEAYCAFFAPVRTLPAEILHEIFDYAACSLDGDGPKENAMNARVQHASLRALAGVCSLWKKIVLSSPALWVRVDSQAIEGATLNLGLDATAQLVDSALRRACRGAPMLNLRLQHVETSGGFALQVLDREIVFEDGSTTHILAQCRHLHITTLHDPGHLEYLSKVAVDRMRSLETFRLMASAGATEELATGALNWLAGAPKLRALAISGILVDRVPLQRLDALQLLTCIVYPDSLDKTIQMLAVVPAHIHCRLPFYPPGYYTPAPLTSLLTNSSVERLSIGAGNQYKVNAPQAVAWFLESLISRLALPNLRSLCFETAASGDGSRPLPLVWATMRKPFIQLAERSSFHNHLLSLDLRGVQIASDEIHECLKSCSGLESLAVADQHDCIALVTDDFLGDMGASADDSVVLGLKTLTVHTRLEFSDAELVKLLVSRARVAPSRFSCHVYVVRGHWEEERRTRLVRGESELGDLRRSGKLSISFSSLATD